MDALAPSAPSRFGALASPDYRRFWLGSVVSVGAYQLLLLGQGWLVFELSGSPLDLGYLGAAAALPNIVLSLFGGVLADRLDKRRLLIATSLVLAALLALLTLLDATGRVRVWQVLAIVAAISAVTGLDWPARQAFFPSLIERDQMMSAVALNSMVWQATRMALPAAGGVIIALTDTWVVFLLGVFGFLGMSLSLAGVSPRRMGQVSGLGLAQFLEGVAYVVRHRLFSVLIPLTYCNMLFGTSVVQIMPAFARLLGAGETGYGLLVSATGLGSIVGTLVIGPYQRSPHLGRIMLGCLALCATALEGFAAVTGLWSGARAAMACALGFAFAMGMMSSMYLISSMTVMQLTVPDGLRGRVMSLYGITYSLIPLGGLIGGALAEASSAPLAVAANAAVLLLAVALVAATQPGIRGLDGAAVRHHGS